MSKIYGLWTVLGEGARRGKRRDKTFVCRCACGTEREVLQHNILAGTSASCGCDKDAKTAARSRTHGMSHTHLYRAWAGMWERCTKPAHKSYAFYGGRGITVCKRWELFENFYADMGERPEGMTLDRRDNEQGYAPDNCFWATHTEQMNNTRSIRRLTYGGETLTLAEWALRLGVTKRAIKARITYGWGTERICTAPHLRLPKGE